MFAAGVIVVTIGSNNNWYINLTNIEFFFIVRYLYIG